MDFTKVLNISENYCLEECCDSSHTKDFGTSIDKIAGRNILGKLSSAHIRQFVSPFYKQIDACANIPSKMNNFSTIEEIKAMSKKITIRRSLKRKSFQSISPSIKTLRADKRQAKIEDIVARISIPTQSCLLKQTKQESTTEPKKSALEYSKRTFTCEQCKKRNMG